MKRTIQCAHNMDINKCPDHWAEFQAVTGVAPSDAVDEQIENIFTVMVQALNTNPDTSNYIGDNVSDWQFVDEAISAIKALIVEATEPLERQLLREMEWHANHGNNTRARELAVFLSSLRQEGVTDD